MSTSRRIAITREISDGLAACELTHIDREPIDVERARRQHREYEACLDAMGCMIERVSASEDMPDSVFIEDAAVVFDEIAVVTRPGAESRRVELEGVGAALGAHRLIARVGEPGTLDGGDVLVVDRTVFVGCGLRSNAAGVEQLQSTLKPYGYTVTAVDTRDCLHLKSAVTRVGARTLLINPRWIDPVLFDGFDWIESHVDEPFAANALRIGAAVVSDARFERTHERIRAHGIEVVTVDASELAKAEGGVTCCSLIIETPPDAT